MNRAGIVTVVPFFNRGRTVLTTLASVAAQTKPTDRLIVVDDGSTDGGAEFVLNWLKQHLDQVESRLIVQENAGASAARNRGLALAGTDEFIAFLDSDDVWPVDFLERTSKALSDHPSAVAASCDRRYVFADGAPAQWQDSSEINDCAALWMLDHGANIASCTLFRTDAVRQHGGFDARLRTGEDIALFMPVSLDGPWLHVPGEAVTFQHGEAEHVGEEGNLSFRYHGSRRKWAALFEDFFVRGAGREMLDDSRCPKMLAKAWNQAGCELADQDLPHDAAECFRKAIAWNPWRTKSYSRLLRAWGHALGTAPEPPLPHCPPAVNTLRR